MAFLKDSGSKKIVDAIRYTAKQNVWNDPEEEVPQPEFINVEDAIYAYNWKTTDTPASDGKTEGNLKDLYEKVLNLENRLNILEQIN